MTRRAVLTLLVGAIVAASLPARGVADGDPASDVLLASPTFFPYEPPVAMALQTRLDRALARLDKQRLNLKVAIVESPIDLGAIPNLFGRPQMYADFLEQEIAYSQPQPLLVVMPAGFGLSHAGPRRALDGLKVDAAHKSNGLTRSAILAVQRIARAVGRPVGAQKLPATKGSSGSGTSPPITFGAPALLVILGALIANRLRRRSGRERHTDLS